MKVDTPVATMGIRGTTPHVEISDDGTVKFSTLIEEGKSKLTKKPGTLRGAATPTKSRIPSQISTSVEGARAVVRRQPCSARAICQQPNPACSVQPLEINDRAFLIPKSESLIWNLCKRTHHRRRGAHPHFAVSGHRRRRRTRRRITISGILSCATARIARRLNFGSMVARRSSIRARHDGCLGYRLQQSWQCLCRKGRLRPRHPGFRSIDQAQSNLRQALQQPRRSLLEKGRVRPRDQVFR